MPKIISGQILILDDSTLEPVFYSDDLKTVVQLVNLLNDPIGAVAMVLGIAVVLSCVKYLLPFKNEKKFGKLN